MRVYELQRHLQLGDEAWPLRSITARIDMEVDFGNAEVPAKAARRMALKAVQQLLEAASPEELAVLSQPMHRTGKQPEPEERNGKWEKPEDLDLRVVKSAHRIITEVAKRGASGRAVLASELVGSIGLSAPTIGRLLRDGEEAHQYLSKYVRVAPEGRTKALDLTNEGRYLASQIRAGVVPS